MLLTETDAKNKRCPFMDGGNCLASECCVWRYSRLVDRRNSKRLGYCGAGGEKGAWNVWAVSAAASAKDAKPAGNDEAQPAPRDVIG